jgi:hypothetical protein
VGLGLDDTNSAATTIQMLQNASTPLPNPMLDRIRTKPTLGAKHDVAKRFGLLSCVPPLRELFYDPVKDASMLQTTFRGGCVLDYIWTSWNETAPWIVDDGVLHNSSFNGPSFWTNEKRRTSYTNSLEHEQVCERRGFVNFCLIFILEASLWLLSALRYGFGVLIDCWCT